MARKNIFQLVEENYNIFKEANKLAELFVNEDYFSMNTHINMTFSRVSESYLFEYWEYANTCIDLDEYLESIDVDLDNISNENSIINFLEFLENFIKLHEDCFDDLEKRGAKIQYRKKFETQFIYIMSTLEKKMGLTKRVYKSKIVLYPKNAPLEKVVDSCDDEDVQWELIRYVREDLSLSKKRKSLAYLATGLYIEEDDSEKEEPIKSIVKNATTLLNNLHIRHNNKTGKWENQAFKDLDENDAITLCDMVYNEMLTIVLLREHKKYEDLYSEFRKKQKEAKAKRKVD